MQKVLIAGGGLNGLVCAVACGLAGFSTVVCEREELGEELFAKDKRTSVLTHESMKFFEEIGVATRLTEFLAPIEHIYTFEADTAPVLSFDAPSKEKPFGHVVHNHNLKRVLHERALELGVRFVKGCVEEPVVSPNFITFDKEDFKLLLICDGRGSLLAKNFGVKRENFAYRQEALVFNIKHEEEHKNIAIESFNPNGPLAVLPLQEPRASAVIWSVPPSTGQFLKQLSEGEFMEHFRFKTKRFAHIGNITNFSNLGAYPLSLSFARKQALPRALLMGDAFNAIHPVAGQAFNMSLKDVKNLLKHLKDCARLGLDIGGLTGLEALARSNLRHHIELNLFCDLTVRGFSSAFPPLKFVRTMATVAAEEIKPLKRFLIKKASGI